MFKLLHSQQRPGYQQQCSKASSHRIPRGNSTSSTAIGLNTSALQQPSQQQQHCHSTTNSWEHPWSSSSAPCCCKASNKQHPPGDGAAEAPAAARLEADEHNATPAPDALRDNSGISGRVQGSSQQQLAASAPQQQQGPTFLDGINWYCYCCLGLLFLTDFTPLGQWLLLGATLGSAAGTAQPPPPGAAAAAAAAAAAVSGSFPAKLALLQWGVFVLPSLLWVQQRGWSLRSTLRLKSCKPKFYAAGLLGGPLLWLCINAAVAIRTGQLQHFAAALTGGVSAGAAAASGAAAAAAANGAAAAAAGVASPGMLLLGVGSPHTAQGVVLLLLFAALSPAVAEELLFRGLLLTAVQARLGSIDAVAVVAALFALIHLDLQHFFHYCVLGGAAGLLVVRSGSMGPAVVLHAAFNATAVAAGLLLLPP